MFKGIIPALAALACLLPAKAFPGSGSVRKVSVELLEELAQVASRESSDFAAKAATRKMAERLGREVPEVEALLTRYGDALGLVLRNSERARLFNELGDDAAQAFIKNGAAAESVLAKIPTVEMARTLRTLHHADARYLDALVQRGQVSVANSTDWLRLIKEKGGDVLAYAWNHPKMTAAALLAGGVGTYALTHPGTAMKVIQQAKGGVGLHERSPHPDNRPRAAGGGHAPAQRQLPCRSSVGDDGLAMPQAHGRVKFTVSRNPLRKLPRGGFLLDDCKLM